MTIFRKPSKKNNGLKFLGYGETNVGKSSFALTFPEIVGIDSEAGWGEYEDNPNIIDILNTVSYTQLEEAIDEASGSSGTYQTMVIDSESKIQDALLVTAMEVEENRARKKGGEIEDANIAQRGYGRINIINKKLQNLKIKLSSMGITLVSIAQQEDIKEKRGDNYVKVGVKPIVGKRAEYDYDVILRFYTKSVAGKEKFYAQVEKDRTGVYKKNDVIENPSYENWKAYIESKKTLKTEKIDMSASRNKDVEQLEKEGDRKGFLIDEIKNAVKESDKSKKEMIAKVLMDSNINLKHLDLTELDVLETLLKKIKEA